MFKPILVEKFTDDNQHSHWELHDEFGDVLWEEPADNDDEIDEQRRYNKLFDGMVESDKYQRLFSYLSENGFTALESNLHEIVSIVKEDILTKPIKYKYDPIELAEEAHDAFKTCYPVSIDGAMSMEFKSTWMDGYKIKALIDNDKPIEQENQRLKDWKESTTNIMNNIKLQECGKLLNLPLGEDISKHIYPAIKKYSELPDMELVAAAVKRLVDLKESCLDNRNIGDDGEIGSWITTLRQMFIKK